MSRRKLKPPHAEPRKKNLPPTSLPPLPPVAPPQKRPWLLGLSVALLIVWLIILAGLALYGEARLGQ